MDIDVVSVKNSKPVTTLRDVSASTTIYELKEKVEKVKKLYPERQEFRLEPKGKGLNDKDTLETVGLKSGTPVLYLKDLGPQIGWTTVFICEYTGPLLIYLYVYSRPWLFYGDSAASLPMSTAAKLGAACWTLHYVKRLLETQFIHRFSHATMPIRNLIKNCAYYWLFTLYITYHINHPLYTPPSIPQMYGALGAFLFCECGNLSIHVALRNLRPAGSTQRKIPLPSWNPFTALFRIVSCPNYTYECGSWIAFTVMTQCLPAALFTIAGFYQMAVWALGKHRAYKREFKNYPKGRKAIVPFIL